MNKIVGFFQDNVGALSMSRLTLLGAFIVASVVILWVTYGGKMNEGYFGMYLATFTGSYLTSKKIDAGTQNAVTLNQPAT